MSKIIVSIPFIAGQWSLLSHRAVPASSTTGFNPLHCGAVVASGEPEITVRLSRNVSIPFIAGQWSLQIHDASGDESPFGFQSPSLRGSGRFTSPIKAKKAKTDKFQSPSLRGSGRFQLSPGVFMAEREDFNPLHCGAVVASRRADRIRA